MMIGAYLAGQVYNGFLGGAASLALDQWRNFWILPSAFAAVILLFFTLAFHDREAEVKRTGEIPAGAEAPTPAGP
jgi:hypothetical protein